MPIRDIIDDVERWESEQEPVALATVVRTWGSGPRGAGAKMAITRDARIAGSVSGGCVESSVVDEARDVLSGGAPKLLEYGVSDETAWDVGLSCGGTIQIFVEPLTAESEYELRHLPGVLRCETYRAIPVRLRPTRDGQWLACCALSPRRARAMSQANEKARRAASGLAMPLPAISGAVP